MIKKIILAFSNMNSISKNLLKYGLQFAFGVCIIGVILYIVNTSLHFVNLAGEKFSADIISTGVTLISVFTVGSLFIDYIHKKIR